MVIIDENNGLTDIYHTHEDFHMCDLEFGEKNICLAKYSSSWQSDKGISKTDCYWVQKVFHDLHMETWQVPPLLSEFLHKQYKEGYEDAQNNIKKALGI